MGDRADCSIPWRMTDAPKNLLSSARASMSSLVSPLSTTEFNNNNEKKKPISDENLRTPFRRTNSHLPKSAFRILVNTSCTSVTRELSSRNDRDVVVALLLDAFTWDATVFSSVCLAPPDDESDLADLFCFRLDETEMRKTRGLIITGTADARADVTCQLPVACWNLCWSALIESPRTRLVLGVDLGDDSSVLSYPFVSLDERLLSWSKPSWLNLFWMLSNLSLVRLLFTDLLPSARSSDSSNSSVTSVISGPPPWPMAAVTVVTLAIPFLASAPSGL